MSIESFLEPPPGAALFRNRPGKAAARAPALAAPGLDTKPKRARAAELLKTLLGIHQRQKAEIAERVSVRLSVFTPSGAKAVTLWVNGQDSLR